MRFLRLVLLGVALSCVSVTTFAPTPAHATAHHRMSKSELIREVRYILETRITHLEQQIQASYRVLRDPNASPEQKARAWDRKVQAWFRMVHLKHELTCLPHRTKRQLRHVYHKFTQNMSETQNAG